MRYSLNCSLLGDLTEARVGHLLERIIFKPEGREDNPSCTYISNVVPAVGAGVATSSLVVEPILEIGKIRLSTEEVTEKARVYLNAAEVEAVFAWLQLLVVGVARVVGIHVLLVFFDQFVK